MSNLKILHLSDVHFGHPDPDDEQENIIESLATCLFDNQIKVDLIIFTGDLTQSALPSEFQQANDTLKKLQQLTGGKIVTCPGNHDVDRLKADRKSLRLAFPTEESFNISKTTIYKEHEHLTQYLSWCKNIADEDQIYLDLWKNNIFAESIDTILSGFSVRLLGINTAALSCGNDDKDKLCVDIGAINRGLRNINTDKSLVIAFGHHSFDWLAKWNADKVKTALNQENGAHLYLHGHNHEQELESNYSQSGSGICTVSGGATYQGSKWPQYFSVISVDFEKKSITPEAFQYVPASGRWDKIPAISRPLPVRLPTQVTTVKDNQETLEEALDDSNSWDNPFDNVASSSLKAHIIPKLFVDENNFLNRVSKRFESMLEGQRGTGKTMLLRHLSVQVIASSFNANELSNGLLKKFINKDLPLGIYIRLSNAGFNRSDFEVVDNKSRRNSLFNHRLSIYIITYVIEACGTLILEDPNSEKLTRSIAKYLKRLFRNDEFDDVIGWPELEELVTDLSDDLMTELDEHIASQLPGGDPTNFNPRFTLAHTVKKLLAKIKSICKLPGPFFILLDDFDTLNKEQQTLVFETARERDHTLLCFKYGIMTGGQKSFMAGDNLTYREGDDYDHIPLQWHDKGLSTSRGSKGNYRETVIKIAQKRLDESNWPDSMDFKSIYSTWTHGNKIRNEVKELARQEYDELKVGERPSKFSAFWTKQGEAKYFRYLRFKKIEHKYAGLDNIVGLSSGIFRQFLEINSRIILSALDRKWGPDSKKKIGSEVQNSTIREYSEDMLRSLGETAGDTSSLSNCNHEITSAHLVNLCSSLIGLFSSKLYGDSKDAEVITISVKGHIDESSFAKAILDVAVRESILQRRSVDYPAKTRSQGKLPTYALNRRLAPKGNLGHKMQGRYEISCEDIELAAKDKTLFLANLTHNKKSKKNKNQGELL